MYTVTEPNRTLIISMIDQDNVLLASTEAAIAVAVESEATSRSEVEKAKQAVDDATNMHRLFAENLEALRMNAQRIRETIAMKQAMLSVVRLLPAELIEEIALNVRDLLLFPDDPASIPPYPTKDMLSILAVCRRWRKVLRAASQLWQILPMRPHSRGSIKLVASLRPLVLNRPIHWWLHVRSPKVEFNEDMETFQRIYSDCTFEEGQWKSLTLVFEATSDRPNLRLPVPTVTTLVVGVTPKPTYNPPSQPYCIPYVVLQPEALPALKSLELRGIRFELKTNILPHLHTFIYRGTPPDIDNFDVRNVLDRCPKLSKLKVDHCLYRQPFRSDGPVQPPPGNLPKHHLAITEFELDLFGMNSFLRPLGYSFRVDYEFSKLIKTLTLTNHLHRLTSTPPGGYMPSPWEGMSIEYDSLGMKRLLRKIHGVKQLYLRIGGGATLESKIPFTFRFQTDVLAPLNDVESLVLKCAAGCPDAIRVTLEGLHRDPNLFPQLREIRLEECKTMTSVWEPLVQAVRARACLERVVFVECAAVPGACPELDDLLASRTV